MKRTMTTRRAIKHLLSKRKKALSYPEIVAKLSDYNPNTIRKELGSPYFNGYLLTHPKTGITRKHYRNS